MLYLILIVFGVFVIFWLGDLFITLNTIKHLGHKVEINPIIRMITRARGKFIYIFKIIEIGIFIYLIWYLSTFGGDLIFRILLGFILLYSLLVLNNAHVLYKATQKESKEFKFVYLGLVIAILLFIYLNYLLYQDLGISYNALAQSNSDYNNLYWQCKEENKSEDAKIPKEMNEILKDLNLPIRR